MEEEIVTTTPEPSPEPEPAPALEPEPGSAPEPSDPVTVVSVDELIDRLVQNAPEEEETVSEELPFDASGELPGEGDVGVDDVVPGLIGDAIDLLLGIRKGMENVESIEHVVNHPALTTPFQEYTVTEGLLLLLLLFFFLKACMDMIRRAFSWLL